MNIRQIYIVRKFENRYTITGIPVFQISSKRTMSRIKDCDFRDQHIILVLETFEMSMVVTFTKNSCMRDTSKGQSLIFTYIKYLFSILLTKYSFLTTVCISTFILLVAIFQISYCTTLYATFDFLFNTTDLS